MSGSSWFQLRTQEGKNVDLKRSVLMKGIFDEYFERRL